jgi:hypothetical protein
MHPKNNTNIILYSFFVLHPYQLLPHLFHSQVQMLHFGRVRDGVKKSMLLQVLHILWLEEESSA